MILIVLVLLAQVLPNVLHLREHVMRHSSSGERPELEAKVPLLSLVLLAGRCSALCVAIGNRRLGN